MKHLPKAHILACAPSNSGADLLCQRLRVHLPSSIYRLLAPSRDIRMVPEDIKVPGEVCRGEGWQVPGGSGWMLSPGNGVTWILILAAGALSGLPFSWEVREVKKTAWETQSQSEGEAG